MTVFWVEAVLLLLSLAGGKVIKLRDGLWEGDCIKETKDEVRFGVVEDRMIECL